MIEDVVEEAFFEISGVRMPLPKGYHFCDKGASQRLRGLTAPPGYKSIEKRMHQIRVDHLTSELIVNEHMGPNAARAQAEEMYTPFYILDLKNTSSLGGRTLGIQTKKTQELFVYILYLDMGREDINLLTRAHEEFHAMTHIPGAVDVLQRYVQQTHNLNINFQKIRNREVAGDLNGIIALAARGINPQQVLDYFKQRQDWDSEYQFKKALGIYQKASGTSPPSKLQSFVSRLPSYLRIGSFSS